MDTEKILLDLMERITKLEARSGRTAWWQVAGGIASIAGATLAAFSLWAILTQLVPTN